MARAVSHLGLRRCAVDGSGSFSSIEDVDQRARRVLSRETEEDLFEPGRARDRGRPQLVHGATRADHAVLNDSDPVAQRLGDFERVRRHHDRVAAVCVFFKEIFENTRRFGVESHHGLVDDDHVRPVHEGARDDELLPHAVAVALDQLVAPFVEIEQREELARAMLDHRPVLLVQPRDESKKLGAGQLLIDERPIGDEAQLALGGDWICRDVDPADLHGAAGRSQNAGNDAQRRRLPGAIRAEEAEQLSARHLEIDRVHRGKAAVPFDEIRDLDHRSIIWAGGGAVCRPRAP